METDITLLAQEIIKHLHAPDGSLLPTITFLRERYEAVVDKPASEVRKWLETTLFRIYECYFFHYMDRLDDFDVIRYLEEDPYYQRMWEKADEKWNPQISAEVYDMAVYNVRQNDLYRAGLFYGQAAAMGDPDAQCEYGISRTQGEGGAADPLEGSFWFWESAKHGNLKAMRNLAVAYRNGIGVHEDGLQMLYWCTKAAASLRDAKAVKWLSEILQQDELLIGGQPVSPKVGESLRMLAEYPENDEALQLVGEITAPLLKVLMGQAYNIL